MGNLAVIPDPVAKVNDREFLKTERNEIPGDEVCLFG